MVEQNKTNTNEKKANIDNKCLCKDCFKSYNRNCGVKIKGVWCYYCEDCFSKVWESLK